jgi:hypothetical protein
MPKLSYREIDDPRLRGWIVYERVRCGSPGCHCSTQKRHGPYPYLYFRAFDSEAGTYRLKKEYVKPSKVRRVRQQIRRAKARVRREHQATRALLAHLEGLVG